MRTCARARAIPLPLSHASSHRITHSVTTFVFVCACYSLCSKGRPVFCVLCAPGSPWNSMWLSCTERTRVASPATCSSYRTAWHCCTRPLRPSSLASVSLRVSALKGTGSCQVLLAFVLPESQKTKSHTHLPPPWSRCATRSGRCGARARRRMRRMAQGRNGRCASAPTVAARQAGSAARSRARPAVLHARTQRRTAAQLWRVGARAGAGSSQRGPQDLWGCTRTGYGNVLADWHVPGGGEAPAAHGPSSRARSLRLRVQLASALRVR